MKIKIHEAVFRKQPTFRRGVVVVSDLCNIGIDAALDSSLQQVCREAAQAPIDLTTDPRITLWTSTFHSLGMSPKRYPPAHMALRRRVQQPDATLPFINKAVAVMNQVSIEHVLPIGGDDLVRCAEFGHVLDLSPAIGCETFAPLGNPEQREHPAPGEIILSVGGIVCCRRWCWRNGYTTRITEDTTSLAINIDGLGPDSESKVLKARDHVADLLRRYGQATTLTGILTPYAPELQFS